jgi:hypothetical protein
MPGIGAHMPAAPAAPDAPDAPDAPPTEPAVPPAALFPAAPDFPATDVPAEPDAPALAPPAPATEELPAVPSFVTVVVSSPDPPQLGRHAAEASTAPVSIRASDRFITRPSLGEATLST